MQDLDDGVRVERRRLSAVPGDAATKVKPFIDDIAVVPAHRLLDAASALSDGATLMHARLRHLDPDVRDDILNLMAGQLSGIVNLWAELVRGVVGSPEPDVVAGPGIVAGRGVVAEADVLSDAEVFSSRESLPRTEFHPSAQGHRTLTDVGGPGEVTDRRTGPDPGPRPEPDPGVRLLPRRAGETSADETEIPNRDQWATPLRSVKVEEPDTDYEGDRLTRDELTGVLNRQAGFAALGRDLDRCRRAGERFVIGYLDVDGLKEINRADGRRGGDELLRKVTAALRATLRSYDVIMRLGGDEFLFSLPGADMATAELRANEFGVILAEESSGGSASIGFGELRGDDTLDEIISRAEIELVKGRRARVRSR